MDVIITDLYYIIGAEGDEGVKIEYSLMSGALRIVGRLIASVGALEDWTKTKVEQVVEADIRKRADTIATLKTVAQNYKNQTINIPVEDLLTN